MSRPATRTVLIVEDEPVTALALAAAVRRRDLSVSGPHRSPSEALSALAGSEAICAALLDVSLGDGLTSASVAAALSEAGLPFAFVTGYGPETNAVVRDHPDRLVIPKPVDDETLDMILTELLGRDGPGREGG